MMYLVSLFVLLVSLAVVSYPLFFQPLIEHEAPPDPESEFSERDALLEALSDLELSFGTKKLTDLDYQLQKRALQTRYAEVLKA